ADANRAGAATAGPSPLAPQDDAHAVPTVLVGIADPRRDSRDQRDAEPADLPRGRVAFDLGARARGLRDRIDRRRRVVVGELELVGVGCEGDAHRGIAVAAVAML